METLINSPAVAGAGFAGVIAAYLVYYVTTGLKKTLDANTEVIRANTEETRTNGLLLRLLLQKEGVQISADK